MMRLSFGIVVRLALACALMLAAVAASAATVMVYGDSLSAGFGLPAEQGWVDLLAKRLARERPDYKVVNASISGETTSGGRSRIAADLERHRPHIVILALGANDGLRGGTISGLRANLEAIVDACRRAKARVLLIGMQLPPNYGPAYTQKFHAVFREVAAKRNLPFVPFLLDGFAEDRKYFQADGLHPTAEAQPIILETVWKGLKPMLGSR